MSTQPTLCGNLQDWLNMVEKEALRLELLVIMTLSVCILEFKVNGSDMYTQEVVSRRHGGDIYQLSTRDEIVSQTCHDDNNLTYLVSEQRCVRNQELLNDRGWPH